MPIEPLHDPLQASATAYAAYLFSHPPARGSYDLVAMIQRRFPSLSDEAAVDAAHAAIESSLAAHRMGRLPPGQSIPPGDVPIDPTIRSGYRYQVNVSITDRGGQTVHRTLSIVSGVPLSMSDIESEVIEWATTQAADSPPGGAAVDPLVGPYIPVEIEVSSASRSPEI